MKKRMYAMIACLLVGVFCAVSLCVRVVSSSGVSSVTARAMTIVLDAGHGGIDGGVSGRTTGVKESDINLAIVLRLAEYLRDIGFSVALTRKTEAGLYDTTAKGFKKRDMQKRKEIIERENPAFVVSVHQNYYPSSKTRGAQVFFAKDNADGERFATALQNRLNDLYKPQGVKERKASSGDYFILKCTESPSVIVECGFLSNAEDERLLSTIEWQRKLVETIARGILDYHG